jgi:RHS repeat-associated protein
VDDQTTVNTNIYVWGLDLSGTLQGAGGVGGLLSQTVIEPSSVKRYFPLADANGNCVSFIDNAGNVQAHYTYDAFGNTVSQSGSKQDDFPFRFSTKYLDDETGLIYYGFRYLSPALGRWLRRDPIEEEGGYNLMVTIGNNLVNSIDLLGQQITGDFCDSKTDALCDIIIANIDTDAILEWAEEKFGGGIKYIDYGPSESDCESPEEHMLWRVVKLKRWSEKEIIKPLSRDVVSTERAIESIKIMRFWECRCPCPTLTFRRKGRDPQEWSKWKIFGIYNYRTREVLHVDDLYWVCTKNGLIISKKRNYADLG